MKITSPDDIANELMSKLNGKVSYLYNDIPTIVPVNNEPFVVCSANTTIKDMSAYKYTVASVDVFVKNLDNGTHNSKKAKIVIDSIASIFPIKSDNYMFNNILSVIPMGNYDKGYNVTRIQIETFIYNI